MSAETRRGAAIRLEDIHLPFDKGQMGPISLCLEAGDVCEILSPASDRVRLLLRFLATLQKPASGRYFFDGRPLDFSAYQYLLPVKARIACITTEVALITNRSIRENILIGDAWRQNTLRPPMDTRCTDLCRFFHLEDKQHLRPATLSPMGRRAVVAVREMAKNPDLILVERPEDFVGKSRRDTFINALRECSGEGATLVFWTDDGALGNGWRTRRYLLDEETFRELPPEKE